MATMRLADARAGLSELVTTVERSETRILVTRDGSPAAVLIGVVELRSLEETIEILVRAELHGALQVARRQAARGEVADQAALAGMLPERDPAELRPGR
ncbi:MAG: type II toxin-antitoxin system Phd/YefM family antitoxin [Actinobacteria bacterium]|nr:type II toxin-antitoxin system Phd/YefM family antitoxin [Actinomycetota bacterium]